MTQIINDGVITDREPDILECEVKWALQSFTTNRASGGGRILVELFQILKDDAVKVLHSICQQIWKTQQWPQDWKRSVFILIPKKGNAKECSNYRTVYILTQNSIKHPCSTRDLGPCVLLSLYFWLMPWSAEAGCITQGILASFLLSLSYR